MTTETTQSTHDAIVAAFDSYLKENEKFEGKGVSVAGTRARASLGDIAKLAKARRAEIQEVKNTRKAEK
jgi:hypothetical protein